MKILIPSHSLEITGEVQQVLLLAAQQGFDIREIELGISPTQYIELVGLNTSRFSTNLFPNIQVDNDLIDLHFVYGDQNQSDEKNKEHSSHIVQIGSSRNGRCFDCWLHQGVETVLVNSSTLSTNQSWFHLAWVVASLALDFPLEDALVLSRAAMNVSRETWPTQFQDFPVIEQPSVACLGKKFGTLNRQSLGLYPVVDSVHWVKRLLSLGINTIQLRIKNPNQENLEQEIIEAIKLGREHKAQVFINDYWKLALEHKAFGVHLGQEDILEADLDLIANRGIKLGLSTHGYFELLRIYQLSPSYIALGHIFPTTTKEMPSKPQGLVRLRLYQKLLHSMPYGELTGIPSVVIGGIDLRNIDEVVSQGVSSIAVVRAITESSDVEASVRELQSKLNRFQLNNKEVSDVI